MKTVTKIIVYSCVFCYFAGLWMIASRFGLIRLITRYGLSESFNQIPKDFPQVKYLYIALAVYTLLFALLSYILYKYSKRTVKEQILLQQETSTVVSYVERMNVLLAQYEHSSINDANVRQKLQTLSRQVSSLPPAVVRNASLKSEVVNIINNLQEVLFDNCSVDIFSIAIDNARDAIDSVKRRSVITKY